MEKETNGQETPAIITFTNGQETPDIRKPVKYLKLTSEPKENKPLFQILSQKENKISGFMGSTHTYELPSRKDKLGLVPKSVNLAFNPEDLDGLDEATLKRKYEEEIENKTNVVRGEDFSDMVAEHAEKQQGRKRKDGKRQKEFKF
jgi:splicing factor 3B subunit 2